MKTIYKYTFNLETNIKREMLSVWKEMSDVVLSEEQLKNFGISNNYEWNGDEIQLKVKDDQEQIRNFTIKLGVKYE